MSQSALRTRDGAVEANRCGSGSPWPRALGLPYRVLASVLGWGAWGLACLVAGVLIVPPTLLLERVWPDAREYGNTLVRFSLAIYIRTVLFARFDVGGREQRLRGPRILVANHQSVLDPIVLIALEPRLAGPIRTYLYRLPILGSIVRLAGFYPSDIGERPSLDQLDRSAEDARDRGGGLLFFPEGSRSKTGEIGRFHRGAFRVAFDHGLPIQPVVIEGLDRVLPPGGVLAGVPGRHPVRIRYLAPLHPPYGRGVRRDVVRDLAARVRATIAGELARLRAERSASSLRGNR